ncbi:hypothetical protein CFOL_v3_10383 [Cephalotus follicularis]|uniref:Secreted protein n=1 Tax=Cephalotus follicularis TaxID=3775 RepID=A0A1Q3BGH5_CEPFO|nr:hypothetical protein CFOL_v3_10383 [Cephalotus follicularis]
MWDAVSCLLLVQMVARGKGISIGRGRGRSAYRGSSQPIGMIHEQLLNHSISASQRHVPTVEAAEETNGNCATADAAIPAGYLSPTSVVFVVDYLKPTSISMVSWSYHRWDA